MSAKEGTPITTESLLVHALKRGLGVSDFDAMSVGMILDYIESYDQLYAMQMGEGIEQATQAAFDAF